MDFNVELILLIAGALVGTAEVFRRSVAKRYEAKTEAMLNKQRAEIEKSLEKERAHIRQMERELEAKLEAQKDEREFKQELEKQTLEFQKLQASWGADGTMEILRQAIDFIENTVITQNLEILKELNRFNQTVARNSDGVERLAARSLENTRLLAGSIDKLRESLSGDWRREQ